MEAKKHPALVAALLAFGLAALTGVGFAARAYLDFSSSSSKLAEADKKVAGLLKSEVALTPDNVELAKANLEALKAAEAGLRQEISGAPSASFDVNYAGAPGDLGAVIKDSVEGWRAACRAAGVRIAVPKPDEFAFGFSRYFQTGNTPPSKFLRDIHRQTRVSDFLVKALLEAKLRDDLRLVALAREPLEIAGLERGTFNPDEVNPAGKRDAVFRREGLVRSEFFSVKFVARTEVLRRFVNAVTASGRSVAVRGVEAGLPPPELLADPKDPGAPGETLALPADLFGAPAAVPGAEAPAKPDLPVVPDLPTLFTVTLEYVEPVKAGAVPTVENANQ